METRPLRPLVPRLLNSGGPVPSSSGKFRTVRGAGRPVEGRHCTFMTLSSALPQS